MKFFGNANKLYDIELVNRYKSTSQKIYLGELYSRYASFLLAICMKYLKNEEKSKDAVMDIFEKLSENILNHEISNFKSWIYVVAKNHCLMQIRSEKSQQQHLKNMAIEEQLDMENDALLHPDNKTINLKKDELLRKNLELLNPEQKTCIKLFYYEDKTYQEISHSTGFEIKKVKSFLQNGKRNLQIAMEEEFKKLNSME